MKLFSADIHHSINYLKLQFLIENYSPIRFLKYDWWYWPLNQNETQFNCADNADIFQILQNSI